MEKRYSRTIHVSEAINNIITNIWDGTERRQRPRGLPMLPVRVEGKAPSRAGGAMAADNPENKLQQVWQPDCTGDCEA